MRADPGRRPESIMFKAADQKGWIPLRKSGRCLVLWNYIIPNYLILCVFAGFWAVSASRNKQAIEKSPGPTYTPRRFIGERLQGE